MATVAVTPIPTTTVAEARMSKEWAFGPNSLSEELRVKSEEFATAVFAKRFSKRLND